MFTYNVFISEAAQLALEAKQFTKSSDGTVKFEKWRHRLEDIMDRIQAEGYRPTCEISGRKFKNLWARTDQERISAFIGPVNQTILELENLVSSFEKFGPPTTTRDDQRQVGSASEQPKSSNTFHIHGGQVQIGDHNIQNIVNALHELKNKIDSADATPEQKHQAVGLLRSMTAHPLVTSVLGGLAGGII